MGSYVGLQVSCSEQEAKEALVVTSTSLLPTLTLEDCRLCGLSINIAYKYCPYCAARNWTKEELDDRRIIEPIIAADDGRYILSIDSGSSGLGYAVWNYDTFKNLEVPLKYGIFIPDADEWYDRIEQGVAFINSVCCGYGHGTYGRGCIRFYVEIPTFRDTPQGHAVARRGDYTKLSMSAGAMCGLASNHCAQFIPVTPSEWKGQLPKKVVELRIRKKLKDHPSIQKAKSHAWDAIGIGLYAKGHFN